MTDLGIVWFRRDLRLDDNPAWSAATTNHQEVQAVYILDPALLGRASTVRRNQLLAHLGGLARDLERAGGTLLVAEGDAAEQLQTIVADLAAGAVYWNTDVTPYASRRDAAVETTLTVPCHRFWGILTQPPGSVLTQKGTLSQVFTPFYNAWDRTPIAWTPPAGPARLGAHRGIALPQPSAAPFQAGGADAAHERLDAWSQSVDDYLDTRDIPGVPGTSELSADLRFGTLGPREIIDAIGTTSQGRQGFLRQLAWRDWYAHLLVQAPNIVDEAVKEGYRTITWRDDDAGFEAWSNGQTGYPLVDAGMRQLRQTGWMHNRVRMVTASFLVKDLLVDWRRGERLFRHLLVDADVSQNVGNWQWTAGTGMDAAPYFRIFNPISQSRKFDPQGDYIRRFIPELAGLDRKTIHAPWEAGPLDLAGAGVILGDTYPSPIVDHAIARDRTLAAYKEALGRD